MEKNDIILSVIAERHSGRAFKEDMISDKMLHSILEAGRWAPSCANKQSWNFVVIKDKDVLKEAHEGVSRGNAWGKRAPVMVLVVAKEVAGCSSHGLPYFMLDCGLAIGNMLLQAVHLGLMGHPTAGWDEEKLREVTRLPEEYRITAVIFFGHEGDFDKLDERTKEKDAKPRTRRNFDEVVHWNRW